MVYIFEFYHPKRNNDSVVGKRMFKLRDMRDLRGDVGSPWGAFGGSKDVNRR